MMKKYIKLSFLCCVYYCYHYLSELPVIKMALDQDQLAKEDFDCSRAQSGGGSGSVTLAEMAQVMRYDHSKVLKHIESLIEGERGTVIYGTKRLKEMADKNNLRVGQIIFGTVSPAHACDKDRNRLVRFIYIISF